MVGSFRDEDRGCAADHRDGVTLNVYRWWRGQDLNLRFRLLGPVWYRTPLPAMRSCAASSAQDGTRSEFVRSSRIGVHVAVAAGAEVGAVVDVAATLGRMSRWWKCWA